MGIDFSIGGCLSLFIIDEDLKEKPTGDEYNRILSIPVSCCYSFRSI
jgi:hypothetical protein